MAGPRPELEAWQDPTAAPLVEINGVTKTFGSHYAVDDVSLTIFRVNLSLLGRPAAARRHCCACSPGSSARTRDSVLIGGEDVTDLPPYRRPVNMMFQSYALFPHLTVADNVAFGLRQERIPRGEIRTTGRGHAQTGPPQ